MAEHIDRKAALIADLERARSRAAAFRREIDGGPAIGERVSGSVKDTIAENRIAWLSGAALVGLLIAKMPPRTKKVVVDRKGKGLHTHKGELEATGKAGVAIGALKLLVDITKPVIMAWATKRLGEAVHVGKQVKHKVEKVDRKT